MSKDASIVITPLRSLIWQQLIIPLMGILVSVYFSIGSLGIAFLMTLTLAPILYWIMSKSEIKLFLEPEKINIVIKSAWIEDTWGMTLDSSYSFYTRNCRWNERLGLIIKSRGNKFREIVSTEKVLIISDGHKKEKVIVSVDEGAIEEIRRIGFKISNYK